MQTPCHACAMVKIPVQRLHHQRPPEEGFCKSDGKVKNIQRSVKEKLPNSLKIVLKIVNCAIPLPFVLNHALETLGKDLGGIVAVVLEKIV